MKVRMLAVNLCLCFWLLIGIPNLSYADSAEVLPKGVFSANVKYSYYVPIDVRFDSDGDEEDLAADFNTALDSTVFPDLGFFEGPPFNLPVASLGNSIVDFEYDFQDLMFTFMYGVTDKLSVGIEIPIYYNKNNVDARLDTSNATVGKNVALNSFLPLTVPGTVPLTDEDIQDLLGTGLDINGDGIVEVEGFGYKRFETWSGTSLSDIEAGARYQYLKTENWRLAFTGGVRFPTGEVDDPDNLVDIGFGTGAWALLFRLNNDYTGIKNLLLNATFRYDLYLPDEEEKRVPDDVNQPITRNKERVDRNLGDAFELEVSGAYEFLEGFSLSALYEFRYKMKDRISGDQGFMYDSLEDETRTRKHLGIIGISYSTIPLFRREKFFLPLVASIEYENLFAGKNILKQQVISFSLTSFF